MCFIFSCTPGQFGFGLTLKSNDQLSISDNRDGFSTSEMCKNAIFRGFNSLFVEDLTWKKLLIRVQLAKCLRKQLGAILFSKPMKALLLACSYTASTTQ